MFPKKHQRNLHMCISLARNVFDKALRSSCYRSIKGVHHPGLYWECRPLWYSSCSRIMKVLQRMLSCASSMTTSLMSISIANSKYRDALSPHEKTRCKTVKRYISTIKLVRDNLHYPSHICYFAFNNKNNEFYLITRKRNKKGWKKKRKKKKNSSHIFRFIQNSYVRLSLRFVILTKQNH